MSEETFSFQECAARGSEGEMRVARYLEALGFLLKPIGQKMGEWPDGADRIYDAPDFLVEKHKTGTPSALAAKTLEVKADSLGHKTGNTVLELTSNVGTGRPGWVYTTKADVTAFLYLGSGKVVLVATERLREALKEWQRGKVFTVNNPLFVSVGLLVPTEKLEAIAIHKGLAK